MFFLVVASVIRLDKALIRPGRIDVKAMIGFCTGYQLQQMFIRFYPSESTNCARQFADRVLSLKHNVSAAQVQGYFMLHKDCAASAIQNADSILNV